jgi:glycosyltransferase involved in cell wall biosynthesis
MRAAAPEPGAPAESLATLKSLAPETRPTVLHLRASGGLFGADRVVLDLCTELPRLGYRALLVPLLDSDGGGQELRRAGEERGIPVRSIELRHRLDPSAVAKLERWAAIEGATILHAHDYKSSAIVALARGSGARIATLHGRVGTDWKLKAYEALEARIVRRFDRVICVSEPMRAAEARPGFAPVVIPNGIDLAPFVAAPSQPGLRAALGLAADAELVGSVGRLSPEKGFDCLLQAVAQLAPERPRLHGVLIGEGPMRAALLAQAETLGIGSRMHFLGLRPDLPALYPELDVFCMTSQREGLPLVLLEALAAERAALVTPVGGIPEVIAARDGAGPVAWTFPAGDAAELARKLVLLLADPELRRSLGAAGRARVLEHFSRARMAQATAALYDQVLGRGAGHAASEHRAPGERA